ncbi:hypothetical protein CPB85DRAFT_1436102 [Mucidula mucida]|nr:hypothetical protein CPB85DRAFT_1436102 [Mucidula mucida]
MAFTIQTILNRFTHSSRVSANTGPFGLVPQELLDIIISHFIDDKVSLLSCALVHPSWTGISRYYLSALNLVISSPSGAKELTKLLRSSREMLSSSITGITLVGDAPLDDIPTRGKSAYLRSYSKLLHTLKAKRIKLRSGAVEKDSSLVPILAQYFPDLIDLRLSCGAYQEIPNFMRALSCSFQRLARLCIERGSCGMDIPDAPLLGLHIVKLSMPCLRTLRVVGWNNELVRWLGNNIVGTLECLQLESTSMRSICRVREATKLIQGNKATLKDLRLTFVKRDAFDLSGLVHLQNLEITSGMYETELSLIGWRLPRSLKRVYLRNVISVLRVHCPAWYRSGDKEEGIVFEGASLHGALGF